MPQLNSESEGKSPRHFNDEHDALISQGIGTLEPLPFLAPCLRCLFVDVEQEYTPSLIEENWQLRALHLWMQDQGTAHEIANQPREHVYWCLPLSMRDGRTDVAIGKPSVELVEMTHLWPEILVSPRCVERVRFTEMCKQEKALWAKIITHANSNLFGLCFLPQFADTTLCQHSCLSFRYSEQALWSSVLTAGNI